MSFDENSERIWLDELERFIFHWEKETETIKERALDPNECSKITDVFHRDSDGLLVRRPVSIADEEIFTRLEQLDGKLNSVLAMVCTSELKTVKKF